MLDKPFPILIRNKEFVAALIEVVIPAYNAESFLRETLISVALQTRPPSRVTVIDDGSTDGTAAVARACAAEMGGRIDIRLIANEGPRGPSAARNTAIRQSEAEWIALLDADDLLAPGHHEALLAVVAGAGNTVLGFGDNTVFRSGSMSSPSVGSYFDSGGLSRLPALERQPGCWSLQDGLFSALLAHGVFGTSACLVQRRASVAAGLFDESMMQSEDTDFFMRLALQGEALFTRTIVAHKRLHDSNLSHERHKLRFCRGTSLSLVKLEAAASSLLLTDQQVCALGGAATASIDGYLYHASLAGWPAYREAAMLAFRTGRGRIATDPRHLARLVLRRWRA